MDHNFEYLENELSVLGFYNAIKRYLKIERSRLKTHLATEGLEVVPTHVLPDQWKRLIKYWGMKKQVKKAETMSLARRSKKNMSSVGRRGRAGKERTSWEGGGISKFFNCKRGTLHNCR